MNLPEEAMSLSPEKLLPLRHVSNWEWKKNYDLETSRRKQRDWGFSGEYVKMMHIMLQQEEPDDFVIGTGQTHTVREFVKIVFEELELDYEDYLVIDPRFYRPAEVEILVANPAKAREKLGWNPKINFKELALSMVRADYDNLKKNN